MVECLDAIAPSHRLRLVDCFVIEPTRNDAPTSALPNLDLTLRDEFTAGFFSFQIDDAMQHLVCSGGDQFLPLVTDLTELA